MTSLAAGIGVFSFSVALAAVGQCVALWALALAWANARIRGFDAERPGSAGLFGVLPPLAYIFCLSVFPLSFLVAWWMLRTPALARQGRVTLVWGLMMATIYVCSVVLAFFLLATATR